VSSDIFLNLRIIPVVLQKSSYEIVRHAEERRSHEDVERGFTQQRSGRTSHGYDFREQSIKSLRDSVFHTLQDRTTRGHSIGGSLQCGTYDLVCRGLGKGFRRYEKLWLMVSKDSGMNFLFIYSDQSRCGFGAKSQHRIWNSNG
jgi:hypothetical protein